MPSIAFFKGCSCLGRNDFPLSGLVYGLKYRFDSPWAGMDLVLQEDFRNGTPASGSNPPGARTKTPGALALYSPGISFKYSPISIPCAAASAAREALLAADTSGGSNVVNNGRSIPLMSDCFPLNDAKIPGKFRRI